MLEALTGEMADDVPPEGISPAANADVHRWKQITDENLERLELAVPNRVLLCFDPISKAIFTPPASALNVKLNRESAERCCNASWLISKLRLDGSEWFRDWPQRSLSKASQPHARSLRPHVPSSH